MYSYIGDDSAFVDFFFYTGFKVKNFFKNFQFFFFFFFFFFSKNCRLGLYVFLVFL